MAILIEPGPATLDWDHYMTLLAARVEWLLRLEEDPVKAAEDLESVLSDLGLANLGYLTDSTPSAAANDLVFGNIELRSRLLQLGITWCLPIGVTHDSAKVRTVILNTDVWSWVASLSS